MASSISGNKGFSNLFRFDVFISFIAENPRSQHALSSDNVKANWKTGTIFSYPPIRSANFSLASMLWYCAEFASDVISAQYCMVAFVTFNFGKNFRRAVNFFCASARLVSLRVKSKFRVFIDLKMAWMYLRLEAATSSSGLMPKRDGGYSVVYAFALHLLGSQIQLIAKLHCRHLVSHLGPSAQIFFAGPNFGPSKIAAQKKHCNYFCFSKSLS